MLLGGCPSAEQWTAYQVGKLRPDEMDQLEAHLELCLACQAALERGGTVADALVAAVKATALRPADGRGVHLPFAEESGCRRVVAKLANESDPTTPYFPAEEDDGPLPRTLGRFKLLEVLGRGGMGVVYRAWDSEPPRQVALKLMCPEAAGRPEARERFLREAQLLARVEHDHVMPIFNSGEVEGKLFIVMPLREGETLADRLKRERPSPPAVIQAVGRQAALGLAAAHEKGVIHRDVKPSNLWLEGKVGDQGRVPDRVRVLDFGLARRQLADPLAAEGAVPGTIGYASPEQLQGAEGDAQSDLFSLGVVLYEMAAGRRPFQGPDPRALLNQVKEHHPPPPRQINPAIPARLSALIMRLLAKEPANRPASAGEVERELARVEGSLRRRRWVRVAAASAAALVVLLAALLAFWRRDLAVTQMKITIDSQTRTLVRDGREPDDRRGPVVVPPGKSFKLEGQLSKPAYWYLVWFDTRGRAVVEAWSSGRQTDVEYPRGNRRQLVDAADPPGTHLLLLLAGSEPPKTGTALLADRLKEIGKPPPMNIRAGGRVVEADNELPSEYLRRIDASLPHGFQRMYPLFFTTTEIKP